MYKKFSHVAMYEDNNCKNGVLREKSYTQDIMIEELSLKEITQEFYTA